MDLIIKNGKVTSLDVLDQINFFRKEEGKPFTNHKDLLIIIETEFTDINRKRVEGGMCPEVSNLIMQQLKIEGIQVSEYEHPQNKQKYPMYVLSTSQAKQCLLKESKFVRKAVIKKLEELENNKPMTIEEMIISQAQSVLELKDKVYSIEKIVDNTLTIDYGKQREIQRMVARRVYDRLAIPVPSSTSKKWFAALYRELKNKFGTSSYKDILVKDYDLAINFIGNWIEDKKLTEELM